MPEPRLLSRNPKLPDEVNPDGTVEVSDTCLKLPRDIHECGVTVAKSTIGFVIVGVVIPTSADSSSLQPSVPFHPIKDVEHSWRDYIYSPSTRYGVPKPFAISGITSGSAFPAFSRFCSIVR